MGASAAIGAGEAAFSPVSGLAGTALPADFAAVGLELDLGVGVVVPRLMTRVGVPAAARACGLAAGSAYCLSVDFITGLGGALGTFAGAGFGADTAVVALGAVLVGFAVTFGAGEATFFAAAVVGVVVGFAATFAVGVLAAGLVGVAAAALFPVIVLATGAEVCESLSIVDC